MPDLGAIGGWVVAIITAGIAAVAPPTHRHHAWLAELMPPEVARVLIGGGYG